MCCHNAKRYKRIFWKIPDFFLKLQDRTSLIINRTKLQLKSHVLQFISQFFFSRFDVEQQIIYKIQDHRILKRVCADVQIVMSQCKRIDSDFFLPKIIIFRLQLRATHCTYYMLNCQTSAAWFRISKTAMELHGKRRSNYGRKSFHCKFFDSK